MPDSRMGRSLASGYSLKAACSNCGQYGTVDDGSLVCFRCGKRHEITAAERQQRDADLALWRSVGAERAGG